MSRRLRHRRMRNIRFGEEAIVTIVSDSFNRANSTTSLGTADTGHVWSAVNGTWGIIDNRAYIPTDTAGQDIAVVDAGVADCAVQVMLAVLDDYFGLHARLVDVNNYLLARYAMPVGKFQLYKNVAGTFTLLGEVVQTASAGDILRIEMSGSSIVVKVNGIEILAVTDSAHSTATKHGLNVAQSSVSRLDDFKVESV